MEVKCELAGYCSGCPWIKEPYDFQLAKKQKHFEALWLNAGLPMGVLGALRIVTVKPFGMRDKVDMTIENGKIGFYGLETRHTIVDVKECPQMSESLSKWFKAFSSDIPAIEKGSVRLRVAPDGKRGVWLDFSNKDIKKLLDEKTWLEKLLTKAHVEIGQKNKVLGYKNDELKLLEPVLYPWFISKDISLNGVIGGFSQPSFVGNTCLVDAVLKEIDVCIMDTGAMNWLELCCGNGNFTLHLAEKAKSVTAIEMDPMSLRGLNKSLLDLSIDNVKIIQKNIHPIKSELEKELEDAEGILVDPPRSGLQDFLKVIESVSPLLRPLHFIYVSCFAENMIKDLLILKELGYEPQNIIGVDQFPQSPHCEWVVALDRQQTH